jgi:hypothetical protein
MAFITVDNPDINIWKQNPALNLITEFQEFKLEEGDSRSSDILKAIYYIWDPKSDLRDSGVTEKKLIEDVSKNLLGDPDFDWDKYDHIKELYQTNNYTKLETMLLRYEKEINDLNDLLKEWPWSKTDIKDRSEAVKQYKILFDEYIDIHEKAKMEAEELSDMYGGYQKSMLEDFANE